MPAGPARGSVLTPGCAVSWRLALPSLERLVALRLHPPLRLEPGVPRHPAAPWRPRGSVLWVSSWACPPLPTLQSGSCPVFLYQTPQIRECGPVHTAVQPPPLSPPQKGALFPTGVTPVCPSPRPPPPSCFCGLVESGRCT